MKNYLGYLAIATYCISTGAAAVWVTSSFVNIDGATLTFITIAVAWLAFTIINIMTDQPRILYLIKNFSLDVILINIFTLSGWLFMFMALQHIEASTESAIYQGFVPVAVLSCELFFSGTKLESLRTLGAVLISISLALLIYVRVNDTSIMTFTQQQMYTGIVFATIAGICGGVYVFQAAKLFKKSNCSTFEMLRLRFILLILVTGVMSYKDLNSIASHSLVLNSIMLQHLLLLSGVFVIIPMFAFQYAIKHLGSARVSIIAPMVPVVALMLELARSGWLFSWISVLVLAVCIAVVLSNVWLKD